MSQQEPFTIEQFYKFLKQRKLMAGKCLKCGKIHLPPRPLCDNCFSQEFKWVTVSGKGKLLTYTPYSVGIVELEMGLRIPGLIQGLTQQQLKIGMKLELDFGSCSTTQQWPQWPRYCFKP